MQQPLVRPVAHVDPRQPPPLRRRHDGHPQAPLRHPHAAAAPGVRNRRPRSSKAMIHCGAPHGIRIMLRQTPPLLRRRRHGLALGSRRRGLLLLLLLLGVDEHLVVVQGRDLLLERDNRALLLPLNLLVTSQLPGLRGGRRLARGRGLHARPVLLVLVLLVLEGGDLCLQPRDRLLLLLLRGGVRGGGLGGPAGEGAAVLLLLLGLDEGGDLGLEGEDHLVLRPHLRVHLVRLRGGASPLLSLFALPGRTGGRLGGVVRGLRGLAGKVGVEVLHRLRRRHGVRHVRPGQDLLPASLPAAPRLALLAARGGRRGLLGQALGVRGGPVAPERRARLPVPPRADKHPLKGLELCVGRQPRLDRQAPLQGRGGRRRAVQHEDQPNKDHAGDEKNHAWPP
mmetsp:Transcript_32217/g.62917  ORF Transcript_32217/g.62917 Transcript_32217/m.62917 type:complete len:395 (+) Transcript_32217:183-1367(+)